MAGSEFFHRPRRRSTSQPIPDKTVAARAGTGVEGSGFDVNRQAAFGHGEVGHGYWGVGPEIELAPPILRKHGAATVIMQKATASVCPASEKCRPQDDNTIAAECQRVTGGTSSPPGKNFCETS